jgi:hypothetical protein
MRLKHFLVVALVPFGLGGLAFLVAPTSLPPLKNIEWNAGTVLIARAHGADVVGWAVAFWLARNEPSSPALRAILIGSFCYLAIETLVLFFGTRAGVLSGWGGVITDALLAVGFGYFAFTAGRHPGSSATPQA